MAMASQRRQQPSKSRLELLPVELRLAVLERVSSYRDLTALITQSRAYYATFLRYKKSILACVAQAMLGDSFVDACMLQVWEGHLNRDPEEEDFRLGCHRVADWLGNLDKRQATARQPSEVVNKPEGKHRLEWDPCQWAPGPYRHVQLKFIHDWDQHAMASTGEQIKRMQGLLTAGDLLKVLSFDGSGMARLTWHCAQQLAARGLVDRGGWWPRACPHEVVKILGPHGVVGGQPSGGGTSTSMTAAPARPGGVFKFDATETQRLMKTLWRLRVRKALYGIEANGPNGQARAELALDFDGRLNAVEYQEMQQSLWKLKAIGNAPMEPWWKAPVASWLPCWVDLGVVGTIESKILKIALESRRTC